MAGPGYQGEIAAIRCGVGGLSANLNPSQITVKNVIQAEGVVFRQDHWRKEPGTALFGTNHAAAPNPGDATVLAMNDWHPTEGVQRFVHLRGDGKQYISDSGGNIVDQNATTHGSGTGTTLGFYVTGGQETGAYNRKLFLFRSNKMPVYINGDATDDTVLDKPAADWTDGHPPICGLINNGRLWAAGNTNAPHALYASRSFDSLAGMPAGGPQTDFTQANGVDTDPQVLSCFPGVGERIYALRNYQGFIVIFKYPRGIFLQDARDASPLNWLTQQVTDAIGIAKSPYAALQLENDVLFIGSDGQLYLLSAVIAAATGQQNMAFANLAMDLQIYQFLLSAYNRSLLGQVQSVYHPFWQTAHFTIPGPGSTVNNVRFMLDFTAVGRESGDPRFSYSYRDQAASLCLRRDPADFIDKPVFGDYGSGGGSNIVAMEQDTRTTWNGVNYPMRVQMPHTNLGEYENLTYEKFVQFANRNKLWDALEIEFLPFTAATLVISVYIDGIFREQITATLPLGGAPFGATQLDSGAFTIGVSALAGGNVRSIVKRLNPGTGRRISVLFENTTYGEDVALTHLFLYFRPGDTTQTPRTA